MGAIVYTSFWWSPLNVSIRSDQMQLGVYLKLGAGEHGNTGGRNDLHGLSFHFCTGIYSLFGRGDRACIKCIPMYIVPSLG